MVQPEAFSVRELIVHIGREIRRIRRLRKLSLRDLARLSGVSAQALRDIEWSRISDIDILSIYAIAESLDVELERLFDISEIQEIYEQTFASEVRKNLSDIVLRSQYLFARAEFIHARANRMRRQLISIRGRLHSIRLEVSNLGSANARF